MFKIRFYELLRQRASALRETGSHVIVLGDVNSSHKRIDHCDPDDSEARIFLNYCSGKCLYHVNFSAIYLIY